MEKYLGKGILVFTLLILGLAFLFPYEPKLENINELSFNTTGEARLFFNNTRAFYYGFKELEEAGFTTYTFGGTDKTNTFSGLNFFIVQNWRDSEAYIMCRPSALFNDTVLTIGDSTRQFKFDTMTNTDHYGLAAALFSEYMAHGSTAQLNDIFGSQKNTKANITVLKDYFRLIGKYQ